MANGHPFPDLLAVVVVVVVVFDNKIYLAKIAFLMIQQKQNVLLNT